MGSVTGSCYWRVGAFPDPSLTVRRVFTGTFADTFAGTFTGPDRADRAGAEGAGRSDG
ncbi:hypothetical protein GCM10010193_03520 [Kitasatospora atroaurantiaca]